MENCVHTPSKCFYLGQQDELREQVKKANALTYISSRNSPRHQISPNLNKSISSEQCDFLFINPLNGCKHQVRALVHNVHQDLGKDNLNI